MVSYKMYSDGVKRAVIWVPVALTEWEIEQIKSIGEQEAKEHGRTKITRLRAAREYLERYLANVTYQISEDVERLERQRSVRKRK